jgi:hypothetical protein
MPLAMVHLRDLIELTLVQDMLTHLWCSLNIKQTASKQMKHCVSGVSMNKKRFSFVQIVPVSAL